MNFDGIYLGTDETGEGRRFRSVTDFEPGEEVVVRTADRRLVTERIKVKLGRSSFMESPYFIYSLVHPRGIGISKRIPAPRSPGSEKVQRRPLDLREALKVVDDCRWWIKHDPLFGREDALVWLNRHIKYIRESPEWSPGLDGRAVKRQFWAFAQSQGFLWGGDRFFLAEEGRT